jgi:hypothetical protein
LVPRRFGLDRFHSLSADIIYLFTGYEVKCREIVGVDRRINFIYEDFDKILDDRDSFKLVTLQYS